MIIVLFLVVATVHADIVDSAKNNSISIQKISPDTKGGYGYKLQYYVAAPLDIFWSFKTDFDSEILLSNAELIGHRLVSADDNIVVTENRYAIAPGLRFLWQTTVFEKEFRLEFKLLNAEDCRHDFHFGAIQLSPAGQFTQVTQTAFFSFVGASMWVSYPWYGGMKSTLTQIAEWEQKMVLRQPGAFKVAERKKMGGFSKAPER